MANAVKALATLGDPTRRRIFEMLADRPRAVGDLADKLPVTRPAVSQHLKVLKKAGLVTDTPDGTRRIYRIDPQGIGRIRDWLDRHWDQAMTEFKAFADAQTEDEEDEE